LQSSLQIFTTGIKKGE